MSSFYRSGSFGSHTGYVTGTLAPTRKKHTGRRDNNGRKTRTLEQILECPDHDMVLQAMRELGTATSKQIADHIGYPTIGYGQTDSRLRTLIRYGIVSKAHYGYTIHSLAVAQ